jgi:hypothetical protein
MGYGEEDRAEVEVVGRKEIGAWFVVRGAGRALGVGTMDQPQRGLDSGREFDA